VRAALWLICLCCWCASGSFMGQHMLWCRNVASRARWVEEAGAAEVLDNKGKLWLTTGVAESRRVWRRSETSHLQGMNWKR
uniref:Bulb-type lectin domain-containing protein n=1 Tax=Aegilops tauschii subsp. strangulata TaxID=200361 RepID=A0A453NHZ6_AEGTS